MNYIKNFDAEIICGYYVTSLRKQLWNAELGIYQCFKKVCEKYNLKHFLIYGSAIGAVRHKGFIPWDDDMDIGMPRNDFDKLLSIMETEFHEPYSVTYGILENGISPLLRIRDGNTTGIIRGEEKANHNKGAFIEIYVYDNISSDAEEQKKQLDAIEQLTYLANFRIQKRKIEGKDDLYSYIKSHLQKTSDIWDKIVRECKRYNQAEVEFINMTSLPIYGRNPKTILKATWVEDIKEVEFENTKVFVLKENDKYLRQIYGDYMSLPPIGERGAHHDKTVFYDPTKPYKHYTNSELVAAYFNGTYKGMI